MEGIKIYLGGVSSFNDRIYISNGTRLITDAEYHPKAIVPGEPWRAISDDEITKVVSDECTNLKYQDSISLIEIPEQIISLLKDLNLADVDSYDTLNKLKISNAEKYFEAMFSLDEYFEKFLVKDDGFDKLGVHIGKPNLASATVSGSKYVGLHIDYWDELSILETEKATNRVSINLGQQDRFLLFINLSLKQLYDKIGVDKKKEFRDYDTTSLTTDFFNSNPDYPVLKLRVRPFEAYIAPTENIIHDGSTQGNTLTDITLTTRGHFNLSL